ncbi:MAG: FeoB-associated Cys-rich membrane protein [Succiniclasticum sp.]|jgi:uncharacterized membrane protein|nr:FeoB-associated Cys-rich membrane protein [Succiniclasticum sp.]MEE3478801.1 FeoB-associated Cys-rich membrane protein [Succiniclasticum sp.]
MQNLNTIDWILLGLVAVLAILAVRSVLKKPAGGTCGSGCAGCPFSGKDGACQKRKEA